MFVAVWRNAFAALGRPKIFLVATLLALPANGLANAVFMFGFGPIPAMGVAGAGLSSAIVATGLAVGFAAFAVLNTEMRQLCLFPRVLEGRQTAPRGDLPPRHTHRLFEHWRSWCVSPFHRDHQSVRRDRLGGACHHPADGGCRLRLDPWIVAGGNRARWLCRRSRQLAWDGRIQLDSASRWNSFRSSHLCCPRRHLGKLPWLFLEDGKVGTAAVASTAAGLLFLLGVLNLAVGPTSSATAILRGFKDTRIPMVLTLTAKWAIGMPVAFFAGFHLGWSAGGVWTGLVVAEVAMAILIYARLFAAVWSRAGRHDRSRESDSNESKQSTLGKRRLYPHCRRACGKAERRSSRTRHHQRAQGSGSRLRRWDDGIAGGETRSGRAGRRHRAEPCRGREQACTRPRA